MTNNDYTFLLDYLKNKLFTEAYSKMRHHDFSYVSFKNGIMVFEKESDYCDEDFERIILIVSNESAEIVAAHYIEFQYTNPHDYDSMLNDYRVYIDGKYFQTATF